MDVSLTRGSAAHALGEWVGGGAGYDRRGWLSCGGREGVCELIGGGGVAGGGAGEGRRVWNGGGVRAWREGGGFLGRI